MNINREQITVNREKHFFLCYLLPITCSLLPVLCYLFSGDKPSTNPRIFGTQFENGFSIYTLVEGYRLKAVAIWQRQIAQNYVFSRQKRRHNTY